MRITVHDLMNWMRENARGPENAVSRNELRAAFHHEVMAWHMDDVVAEAAERYPKFKMKVQKTAGRPKTLHWLDH